MSTYLLVFFVSAAFAAISDACRYQIAEINKSGIRSSLSFRLFRWICIALSAGCLILTEGLRSHVGVDFDLYYREFTYLSSGNGFYVHSDEGFQILNKIVSWLGFDATAFFMVCAVILIVGLFYLALHLGIALSFAISLFFFSFNYLQSFSLIAQYTSLGVLCVALWKTFDRKYLQSVILILLSAAFHSSSSVFFFVPIANFVFSKSSRPWQLCCVSMLCVAIVSGLVGYLAPLVLRGTRFYVYLVALDFSALNSTSSTLINCAGYVLLMGISMKVTRIKTDPLCLTLLLIQAIACFFSLAQGQLNMLVRLQMSFSFFLVVSLPVFLAGVDKLALRQLISTTVLSLFIIWFFFFPIAGNYYEVLPYQSVIERPL